ncbi:HAD family hydrolase [Nocardiopsis sp. NPDC050513]|uniref:HAD family hydrolase n=1 Tax=Nocardiopsis sp. NPDC050513 TaxID=3364338 RepID=UPI0037BABC5E
MVSPRVIATDLDGTLLRPDGSLSARTIDVLSAADAAGLRVVVVTARPPAATWMITDRLACSAVICGNGAFTRLPGQSGTRVRALDRDAAGTVVAKLLAAVPDVGFAVETGDGLVYEPSFEVSEWAAEAPWSTLVGSPEEVVERAAPVAKLLARAAETPLHSMRAEIQTAIGALAEVTYSGGSRLLEMSAPGVTKGNALAELCGAWNVPAEEVAFFGDMPNDLSALTWAGHGYAMANGHPDLLDPALGLGVAPSHQEDGVARVVEGILAGLR